MYRSWKHLEISNDQELRDPKRIKKLIWAGGPPMWIPIVASVVVSILSLAFAFPLFHMAFEKNFSIELFIAGLIVVAFSIGCIFVMRILLKASALNQIKDFLKNPNEFEFIEGNLTKATYVFAGRSGNRMSVEGIAKSSVGKNLFVSEQFDPKIWPFTTKAGESRLQPGDDWYDRKDRRPYLPIKAYFLCEKKNASLATLVGIRKELIQEALKILK